MDNYDDEEDLILCQNCGSTNLYRDDNNDDLICTECNTQSQVYSQRETAEDPQGFTTAIRRIRTSTTHRRTATNIILEETYVNEDYVVPTLMEFSESFLELIESAAMRSVSEEVFLPRRSLDQVQGFENYKEEIVGIAKEIWCLFLERFDEAANYFMIHYPGFRISLKDRFLTAGMRVFLWKQLHQSYRGGSGSSGNGGADDDDYDYDDDDSDLDDNNYHFDDYDDDDGNNDDGNDDDGNNSMDDGEEEEEEDDDDDHDEGENDDIRKHSTTTTSRSTKRSKNRSHIYVRWKRYLGANTDTNEKYNQQQAPNTDHKYQSSDQQSNKTSWKMLKSLFSKHGFYPKDESLYWKLAIIEIYPNLDLATAIVYLAHLCLQTGVSSYLIVAWAKSGLYPHLLDGYSQLPPKTRHLLRNVKRKWHRDVKKVPSPDMLDDLTSLLLMALVDPNDDSDEDCFLADLYRMNVNRLKNIPFWTDYVLIRQLYFRKLINEKIQSIKNDSFTSKDGSSPLRGQLDGDEKSLELDDAHIPTPTVSKAFYNVGLMMNLFCAYLGLEERVLDFSYALMGFPVFCHESKSSVNDEWLPAPLMLAQPHLIVTPLHALAVIVVACKFVPGWDEWVIQLVEDEKRDDTREKDHDHSTSLADGNTSENSDSDGSEVILAAKRTFKRRKVSSFVEDDDYELSTTSHDESTHVKFSDIPYSNCNGENAFSYLDSMTKDENAIKCKYEFPSVFSWRKKRCADNEYIQNGESCVKGTKVLGDCSLSKNIPCKLKSIFGLSDYYAEKGFNICVSGVYNPYAMLLGYIKDRLYVDVNNLHLLVTRLDDEILSCAVSLKMKNVAKVPNVDQKSFASDDDKSES
mmetsp:Transcript_7480/g.14176  ORF Transcript_7480/g.14176 Transcript_7480/m.14176 type:complete len:856 (+) Transcript_7480:110-2677(+)|eukprot:CAMPEP_0176481866 /NCGR_PEP_ID=MMETSP0200_2-20121128/3064_1 /TAXON_ID=947934 /ORGANISM="Chaetoceros sp., Strain GSL56" /LENGTH=855 /DNA_ID=CAMNT_0017878131 /DNA_START=66 /DNA_END=2633 /DNA_ORIENTATION=-